MPALRRPKPGVIPRPTSQLYRWSRRILPSGLFSDPATKRRGAVRRWLRRCGSSWHSSPIRRLCQGLCFLLFVFLFFYVCWPYTAAPAPDPFVSSDWRFASFDQGSETFLFTGSEGPDWISFANQTLFVLDEVGTAGSSASHGPFRLVELSDAGLLLAADFEIQPETIDEFLLRPGPWSVYSRDPKEWPSHYAGDLASKEMLPADLFLVIDPLVSLSTGVAARNWIWSLSCAGVILVVCILIPRGFCGYLCPLGTLIDIFDWSITSRLTRFQVSGDGWWVHIKYFVLLGTFISAVCGVLVSGYVAAIPVITRGMLFLGEPLQVGLLRGWHQVAPMNWGHVLSILLFFIVLGLGFLRPRFWCKYVCPSGAVFSLGNLFRLSERKVESSCINCNKCVEICPFDAIKPDFTTRVTDCTFCQTCGGVCPTHAIKFVDRWDRKELKVENDPPTHETAIGRRGFLSAATGTAASLGGGVCLALGTKAWGAELDDANRSRPVRPPGSVPEREFLNMCIRCGECFKVCPNNVLQSQGFQQGFEGLWTPVVNADWAGCEPSCNACGQVCPTGAIRALPLEEKKAARMGLAVVNEITCLPFANREACQLCVDECNAAEYYAIEFTQVHTELDEFGQPIAGSGYLAPAVLADRCVGCGLCQTRCHAINVKEKKLLDASAIVIAAGDGLEDRKLTGSYIKPERLRSRPELTEGGRSDPPVDYFVPESEEEPEPFGIDGAEDSPF